MDTTKIIFITAIFRSLLMGIPVVINKTTYRLDDEYFLCVEGYNHSTDEIALLRIDFGQFGLNDFINLANLATTQEMLSITINLALNLYRGENE